MKTVKLKPHVIASEAKPAYRTGRQSQSDCNNLTDLPVRQAGCHGLRPRNDEPEWSYQGKTKKQVTDSYRIFVWCLLAALILWLFALILGL